jgi:hypothetical protein
MNDIKFKMIESPTMLAEVVVDYLNELLEIDRAAIGALVDNKVPCNKLLANHPTVQVASKHAGCHVGLLGILNGLCGVKANGYGYIVAIFKDDGPPGYATLDHFEVNTEVV